jgi:hypothetical protein
MNLAFESYLIESNQKLNESERVPSTRRTRAAEGLYFLNDQERWGKYDQERPVRRLTPPTVPRRPRADRVALDVYEISPRRPRARSDTRQHFTSLEIRPSPVPTSHQEASKEPVEGYVRPEHSADSTESEIDTPKPKIPPVTAQKHPQQADVDATDALMQENIRKISERGEKLDSLQDKTSELSVSAQGFRRGARRQPQSEHWSNPLGWFSSPSGSTDKVPSRLGAVAANEPTVEVIAVESQNRFSALPASSPREEMASTDEVDDLLKEWTTVF